MKNSLNLVLAILFFVVLGCSCPNMEELAKKIDESQKANRTNSAVNTNTSSTPSGNNSNSSSSSSDLTLEKFNQIKNGMSYKEVVDILGKEGTETMDSGTGKYRVQSFKWEGDNYKFITIVMTGDKVSSKFQANLK